MMQLRGKNDGCLPIPFTRVNDLEYARDPEHSLLLYRDEVRSDLDNELAALASDEEETGTSCQKTRQLYWVDKHTLPWLLTQILSKCFNLAPGQPQTQLGLALRQLLA
eukprot:7773920-Ditylum_brightwellii.AAC.1